MDGFVRVLLLEDDELFADSVVELLSPSCLVVRAQSVAVARVLLASVEFDVLLSDYSLGPETSVALLRDMALRQPSLRRVLLSGAPSSLIEPLRMQGLVHSLLRKPFEVARLLTEIRA